MKYAEVYNETNTPSTTTTLIGAQALFDKSVFRTEQVMNCGRSSVYLCIRTPLRMNNKIRVSHPFFILMLHPINYEHLKINVLEINYFFRSFCWKSVALSLDVKYFERTLIVVKRIGILFETYTTTDALWCLKILEDYAVLYFQLKSFDVTRESILIKDIRSSKVLKGSSCQYLSYALEDSILPSNSTEAAVWHFCIFWFFTRYKKLKSGFKYVLFAN